MSRMIQAYFHTENQAEDARVLLLKYDPEMLEVGRLSEGYGGSGRLLLPFMEGGGLISEANMNNKFGFVDVLPTAAPVSSDDVNDGDVHALHYVLSAKVADADYAGAIDLIRRNHGHLEEFDE
ncbi:hypothetical protein [Paenibacillus aceris]|uniref:Uncharacterized protein n=1 Tax=Paenibacillus aceris TaxID=869555 RepID=A0ABS4HV09_9BACL|nr:hypothetical protein [Paenibacillus aceris]MBP1962201.1 hypothetical protein [Paenibacillus aceris]NHW33954.1 hypothetical protein [Paenibacillus aceris]